EARDSAGMPVNVDREDGRGPGRDRRFHAIRVQRVMVRLDVDKDRSDLVPEERVGGGDEREGRRDDLTGEAHALDRDLQRERAVVEQAEVLSREFSHERLAIALEDRAIVGEPRVVPDLRQPLLEIGKGREEGPGDVDRFWKWV